MQGILRQIYIAANNYDLALTLVPKSAAVAEDITKYTAEIYYAWGRHLITIKEFIKAGEKIALAQQFGHPNYKRVVGESYYAEGKVAEELQNYNQAKECYEAAKENASALAYLQLAKLYAIGKLKKENSATDQAYLHMAIELSLDQADGSAFAEIIKYQLGHPDFGNINLIFDHSRYQAKLVNLLEDKNTRDQVVTIVIRKENYTLFAKLIHVINKTKIDIKELEDYKQQLAKLSMHPTEFQLRSYIPIFILIIYRITFEQRNDVLVKEINTILATLQFNSVNSPETESLRSYLPEFERSIKAVEDSKKNTSFLDRIIAGENILGTALQIEKDSNNNASYFLSLLKNMDQQKHAFYSERARCGCAYSQLLMRNYATAIASYNFTKDKKMTISQFSCAVFVLKSSYFKAIEPSLNNFIVRNVAPFIAALIYVMQSDIAFNREPLHIIVSELLKSKTIQDRQDFKTLQGLKDAIDASIVLSTSPDNTNVITDDLSAAQNPRSLVTNNFNESSASTLTFLGSAQDSDQTGSNIVYSDFSLPVSSSSPTAPMNGIASVPTVQSDYTELGNNIYGETKQSENNDTFTMLQTLQQENAQLKIELSSKNEKVTELQQTNTQQQQQLIQLQKTNAELEQRVTQLESQETEIKPESIAPVANMETMMTMMQSMMQQQTLNHQQLMQQQQLLIERITQQHQQQIAVLQRQVDMLTEKVSSSQKTSSAKKVEEDTNLNKNSSMTFFGN